MGAGAEPPVRSIGTDPAAFTEFYRAHVDEVTRFVTRRVADPQLAADLTADVFLAVIEAAERYRGSFGGPRTWLYGIARNVIVVPALHGGLLGDPGVEGITHSFLSDQRVAGPQEMRDAAEVIAAAAAAWAAAALSIRPVTARVRLHRARRALRDSSFQLAIETEVMS